MIKIAFCDDDMEVLHQMNELLDRYRVERNEDITYAAFQSPFELLTEIEKFWGSGSRGRAPEL